MATPRGVREAPLRARAATSAQAYAWLLVGVGAVSFAAIFIRLAAAPSLAAATYRLALASLVLVPLALLGARPSLKRLSPGQWRMLTLAGGCLALHFAFFIASLSYTSVASVMLISVTNPLTVMVASWLFLRERTSRLGLLGGGLAVAGAAVIGYGDFRLGRQELYGDGLALLGMVAISAYLVLGRRLRGEVPVLAYVAPVSGLAAGMLLVVSLAAGVPLWGFSPKTYLFLGLLALVPQLIGHSSLNWALGHVPAAVVAVVVLGEAVGAILLAWALLGETPTAAAGVGGALVLAGVSLTLRR
ncbi:MAG: DMT family transporter [Chloroflexi bacterium]|nr:DMT family transporter [Chloroflexota bacterium]